MPSKEKSKGVTSQLKLHQKPTEHRYSQTSGPTSTKPTSTQPPGKLINMKENIATPSGNSFIIR